MTFNLIDENWILVQRQDGQDEVSLRQAFRESSEIVQLSGELPTQAFAILRLMLAICHDAIGFHSDQDARSLRRKGLDLARIDAYLDEWHDRFELFDEVRPFMQVADLRTAKDEYSGLEKLIADVPNGEQFFTTRAGAALMRIEPGEAARWLVHAQAFDASGIRSGAAGDPLVKGGRGYPIGPSWAGQTGGIVPHGRNLLETLINCIVPTPAERLDRPYWTDDEPQTQLRSEDADAEGPVQTLVWQSRRVRLIGDVKGVVGVVLCQGDKLLPQRMLHLEHLTGWRYSKPQSAKFGRPVYMPNEHESSRAMWRGLPALLSTGAATVEDRGAKHAAHIPPAVLRGTAESEHVLLQNIGIQYGPQKAVIEEIIDDRLEVSPSLLGDDAFEVQNGLSDCIATADACVRTLGMLAANIARAAGEKGDGAGDAAREGAMAEAWARLDQPARRWVSSLRADTDVERAKAEWVEIIRGALEPLANRMIDQASPAAVRGRETNFGHMSVYKAYSLYTRALRKQLPQGQEDQEEQK